MGMLGLGLPLEPGGPPWSGEWGEDVAQGCFLVETYMPAPSESCSLPPFWALSGPSYVGQGAPVSQLLPLYSMGKAGRRESRINKKNRTPETAAQRVQLRIAMCFLKANRTPVACTTQLR